ncbi:OmpA family protein [Azospirillum canadense]|uniref:OmpA family protein n=1 Tax=Azospirillum canadense TaxID=403962 RepID=UPI002227DA84|nr:OmpA family protein [Azospirillum canadense]MCW2235735.1 outer membrane protein OmpA-like peptidoglycan-associated protein [Azospirillum canadense]
MRTPAMKKSPVNRSLGAVSLGALAVALAACSTPAESPSLVQARQTYESAAATPQVASNATLELRRAEESLRRAEAARNDGNAAEMDHQAYLANRQVQIAQDVAALKGAQNVVANADTYRLQSRNAELEQQLRDLQAQRTERGIVMSLGDVLFATGSANLTAGAQTRIDRLAQFLQQYPDRTLQIEGYTDSTGSSSTNLRLSEARAMAVRDALTARGVNPGRIVAQGMGEAQPVASNSTDAGRQQNRRVEVVISDPGSVAQSRP